MSASKNTQDKALAPAEDKSLAATVVVDEPADDLLEEEVPPADITVVLVHHTSFGVPGQSVTLPAAQANALVINARATLPRN